MKRHDFVNFAKNAIDGKKRKNAKKKQNKIKKCKLTQLHILSIPMYASS